MSFCRKPLTSARVAGGTKVGERMSTEQTGRAWDLPADQRASCVLSLADSLSSIRFHLLRSPSLADENGEDMTAEAELAALMAAAKKVEARAHNDAGVYARTTSGTIPYDDAVIFYAMKCSAALLEMIKDPSLIERSARDGGGAAVADADGALDLSQDQMRGFVNGEWAQKFIYAYVLQTPFRGVCVCVCVWAILSFILSFSRSFSLIDGILHC